MFKGKKVTKEVLATIKNSNLRDKLAESCRATLAMGYLNNSNMVTLRVYKDKVSVSAPTLGIFYYKDKEGAIADQHTVDKILSAAKDWALAQINK